MIGKESVVRCLVRNGLDTERAQDWADAIFSEMGMDRWSHQSISDWRAGNKLESPSLYGLKQSLSSYLRAPAEMQCEQISWLYADALCFAEVNNTWDLWGYPKWMRNGSFRWGKLAAKSVLAILSWGIWLVVAVFLFDMATWLGIAWVAISAVNVAVSVRFKRRRDRLMASMIDAYTTLDSTQPSWGTTWRAMQAARDLGAGWPTELLRLVEANAGKLNAR